MFLYSNKAFHTFSIAKILDFLTSNQDFTPAGDKIKRRNSILYSIFFFFLDNRSKAKAMKIAPILAIINN